MKASKQFNPSRFPDMSPKMAAIVGWAIGCPFTDPCIVSMIVTSDNHVLAMHDGDIGYNDYIGTLIQFSDNWERLIESVKDVDGSVCDEAKAMLLNKLTPLGVTVFSPQN